MKESLKIVRICFSTMRGMEEYRALPLKNRATLWYCEAATMCFIVRMCATIRITSAQLWVCGARCVLVGMRHRLLMQGLADKPGLRGGLTGEAVLALGKVGLECAAFGLALLELVLQLCKFLLKIDDPRVNGGEDRLKALILSRREDDLPELDKIGHGVSPGGLVTVSGDTVYQNPPGDATHRREE